MRRAKKKLDKEQVIPNKSETDETSDIGLLWKEIGKLQQQLENEGKGFLGWIRKWGVVVAFVISLLSLTGAIVDLPKRIKEAFPKEVQITKPKAMLSVRNLPAGHALEYEFTISVAYKGNEDYRIEIAPAKLETEETPAPHPSHVTSNKIFCKDLKTKEAVPDFFYIRNGSPITLTCTALFNPDKSLGVLIKEQSQQRLIINLRGEDNETYSIKYCFSPTSQLQSGEPFMTEYHKCNDEL